jgi:hypothetical protein
MRGIFGRRRSFGGGRGVWLGIVILAILALLTRRHEKTANAIGAAYRTAWERVGGREQPTRHDADFSSEQAGGSLAQEHSEEETEVSTAEAEADPGEETKGITRESAGRNEEGDGGEEKSQEDKSAAAAEEGRSDAERLPIEDYDLLTVTQVTQRLRGLSLEEVEQLRDYEAENRNRRSIMQRFDTRIRAAQKNLEKRGDAETEEGSGE